MFSRCFFFIFINSGKKKGLMSGSTVELGTTTYISPSNMSLTKTSPRNMTDLGAEDIITAVPNDTNKTTALIGADELDASTYLFEYAVMCAELAATPLGLVLNTLCMVVFIKSKLAKTSVAIQMIFLAVGDNVILATMFSLNSSIWSKFINIIDFTVISSITCAITFYCTTAGALFTGLLMSVATVERFCCVTFPLKVKVWNLYKKSKVWLPMLVVISLVMPIFQYFCHDVSVVGEGGKKSCSGFPTLDNINFCNSLSVVAILIANVLCTLIIFVFSIMTGVGLYRSRARRQEMGVNNNNSNENREFRITTMLLTEATFFLLARLSSAILLPTHQPKSFSILAIDTVPKILRISGLLGTVNHSANFIIYLVFLPEFRRSFVNLMTSCCRRGRPFQRRKQNLIVRDLAFDIFTIIRGTQNINACEPNSSTRVVG